MAVIDNLASHKVTGVAEAIESAGAKLCYLPPYSPDLNPIEKLWSKVKARLRRVATPTYDALIEAIADALRTVDPTECAHYFASYGYGDYL